MTRGGPDEPAHGVRVFERHLARIGRCRRSAPPSVGCGAHTSGRWPSPASRPEVGSRPIQPAPGTYDLGPRVQIGEVGERSGRTVDAILRRGGVARGSPTRTAPRAPAGAGCARAATRCRDTNRSPSASVSSGVCTPGSMRVVYATERNTRWLSATRKSTIAWPSAPGVTRVGRPVVEPLCERAGSGSSSVEVRREIVPQHVVVRERVALRRLLDEEVERVDDREVGDEIDRDGELARRLGEHEAREVVAERILLPVDEVFLGRDRQRVREHGRAAMRRGPQPNDVGRELHRPVEPVRHPVLERDADAHTDSERG